MAQLVFVRKIKKPTPETSMQSLQAFPLCCEQSDGGGLDNTASI